MWRQLRPTLDVLLNGNKDPGGIYMSNATEIIYNYLMLEQLIGPNIFPEVQVKALAGYVNFFCND